MALKQKVFIMARFLFPVVFFIFFPFFFSISGISANLPAPETLKHVLLLKGIPKQEVFRYLHNPASRVNLKIILKNVTHKEKKQDYKRFLEKKRLARAKYFLLRHKRLFAGVEKAYEVPREIITAILMVESCLGKQYKKHPVLGVYTSLASLRDKKILRVVRQKASKTGIKVNSASFKKRIKRKAVWGLEQLVCLLRLGREKKIDPANLKGSWAGAFGMPQFIPTSFEKYGIDWEKDGIVNLDRLPDSAASVAHYLRAHGWKKSINHANALRVIKHYNHSQPYANTILEISKRLKSKK
jgi:membrane-bound lytic murein transglycosylase B